MVSSWQVLLLRASLLLPLSPLLLPPASPLPQPSLPPRLLLPSLAPQLSPRLQMTYPSSVGVHPQETLS